METHQLIIKKDYSRLIEIAKRQYQMDSEAKRRFKIDRFKREKELKHQIEALTIALEREESVDDEVLRELTLKTIEFCVQKCFETMEMIGQEEEILEFSVIQKKSEQGPGPSSATFKIEQPSLRPLENKELVVNGKPTRPFVLTSRREEITKSVFRPDHSLPTMTIEEYLEKESQNFITGGGFVYCFNV